MSEEDKILEIKSDGLSTKIFVNEKEIPRVINFVLSQEIGGIATLSLGVLPKFKEIKINGKVEYNYYDLDGNKLAKEKGE